MVSKLVGRVAEAVEGWLFRRSTMGRVMATRHQAPKVVEELS